jgi:hypothetical protein
MLRTYIVVFVLAWGQVALFAADGAETGKSDLSRAPYPPSKFIPGITWEWETYTNAAPGSDLWPVTWGSDDNLYVAWGDGGGFGGTDSDGRVAMGIGRIEGGPENWRGFNVNGGKNPEHPASFPQKGKTSGLLFVNGTLYASINLQDGPWPDVTHVLAWSTNNGATWTKADWLFPRGGGYFQPMRFLNFGKNYAEVPNGLSGSAYIYGKRQPSWKARYGLDAQLSPSWRNGNLNGVYLARVPMGRIREKAMYGFYGGQDEYDKPKWGEEPRAQPVFSDTNGVAIAGIVYVPGIKRFLLTCYHTGPGQLGVFEGPMPWGPWSTIAYYENWGGMGTDGEGLSCEFPQKWMSADGITLWCIFSAYGDGAKKGIKAHDRFNLVRMKLTRADTAR